MTTLYLVRHGETVDNVNQIMQGQTQGRLTEKGVSQAQNVRNEMSKTEIDAFVSSDLKRAVDTCTIIAEPHKKPVITTKLLRERDWGDFTGEYIPALKGKEWAENIETIESLKERASDFLKHLKTTYPDKTVLAVGHGIMNKAIQSVYFGKPMNEIQRMENAEIRILEL